MILLYTTGQQVNPNSEMCEHAKCNSNSCSAEKEKGSILVVQ